MASKESTLHFHFGHPPSPYFQSDKDTVQDWYERYKADPTQTIVKDGLTLYKVISRGAWISEQESYIEVIIDRRIRCRVGQFLTDENGHRFRFRSVVMATFTCSPPPDWYAEAPMCTLDGDLSELGEYLGAES